MRLSELLGLTKQSEYVRSHLYRINAKGGLVASAITAIAGLALVTGLFGHDFYPPLRTDLGTSYESWRAGGWLIIAISFLMSCSSAIQLRSVEPRRSFRTTLCAYIVTVLFVGAHLSVPLVFSGFGPLAFVLGLTIIMLDFVLPPAVFLPLLLLAGGYLTCSIYAVGNPDSTVWLDLDLNLAVFVVASFFRYSEGVGNAQALEQLDRISCLDPVTGLGNVTAMRRAVAEVDPATAGVCIVDIDDFKQFNDEYGHLVGNRVLKCVAYALDDAFYGVGQCFRVGGDEFIVITEGASSAELADRVDRSRMYVGWRTTVMGLGEGPTISAGIACAGSGWDSGFADEGAGTNTGTEAVAEVGTEADFGGDAEFGADAPDGRSDASGGVGAGTTAAGSTAAAGGGTSAGDAATAGRGSADGHGPVRRKLDLVTGWFRRAWDALRHVGTSRHMDPCMVNPLIDTPSYQLLYERADMRLYAAKRLGKNQTVSE